MMRDIALSATPLSGLGAALDALARDTRPLRTAGSRGIRDIQVGKPITVPDNFGDTWVTTWADDGYLYAPSNDTLCFGIPAFFTREQAKLFRSSFSSFAKQLTSEQKAAFHYGPLGFNRIEGEDPKALRGITVNRMDLYAKQDGFRTEVSDSRDRAAPDERTWKSSGCTFVDGTLYWTIARHKFPKRRDVVNLRQAPAADPMVPIATFTRSQIMAIGTTATA